jgi:Na+/H+-dicarboxylate symporter
MKGNVIDLLQTVGVYVLSTVVGIILHVLIVLPLVFYWYTDGMNPYSWLYAMRQPMIVAFSTASSAATLPISIRTAVESGLVEETTANTLLPLGATINM